MADRAVERTQQWRQEMREKGYELTHIWIKITDKRLIQDKAKQRHQSLAECIMDGIKALPPVARPSGPSTTLLEARIARLEQALATTHAAPSAHEAPAYINPETLHSTTQPPYPDWMPCLKRLHWRAPKGACALCTKAREERKRTKRKKTDISLELASIPDTDIVSSVEVPIGTSDNSSTEGV